MGRLSRRCKGSYGRNRRLSTGGRCLRGRPCRGRGLRSRCALVDPLRSGPASCGPCLRRCCAGCAGCDPGVWGCPAGRDTGVRGGRPGGGAGLRCRSHTGIWLNTGRGTCLWCRTGGGSNSCLWGHGNPDSRLRSRPTCGHPYIRGANDLSDGGSRGHGGAVWGSGGWHEHDANIWGPWCCTSGGSELVWGSSQACCSHLWWCFHSGGFHAFVRGRRGHASNN